MIGKELDTVDLSVDEVYGGSRILVNIARIA